MQKTDSELLAEVSAIVKREHVALVALAGTDGGLTDYSLKDGIFRLIAIAEEVAQKR